MPAWGGTVAREVLTHGVGALFPGGLLARNLAQQGVPLNREQCSDTQRMQASAEQGLAVSPDGEQARYKRRCQGGKYERFTKAAVECRCNEQRKGQEQGKDLTAKK